MRRWNARKLRAAGRHVNKSLGFQGGRRRWRQQGPVPGTQARTPCTSGQQRGALAGQTLLLAHRITWPIPLLHWLGAMQVVVWVSKDPQQIWDIPHCEESRQAVDSPPAQAAGSPAETHTWVS